MNEFVKDHRALKWRAGVAGREIEHLAVEEPLEIRLGGRRFTLTMRTPGHDEELAAGFLFAEGFINSREELGEIRRLRDSQGRPDPNALDVILNVPSAGLRERLQRNFNISSSCGICGKTSIEALQRRIAPLTSSARISASALFKMPALMREAQAVFSATGGLHAAALFEFDNGGPPPSKVFAWPAQPIESAMKSAGNEPDKSDGPDRHACDQNVRLVVLREDVGRHNAVDKIIGHALLNGMLPLHHTASGEVERSRAMESGTCALAMMVSGRLSFEIVQKAAAAAIAILCAVSAPSSLAVELAEEVGMTLVGFLRAPNFNVYTAEERIIY